MFSEGRIKSIILFCDGIGFGTVRLLEKWRMGDECLIGETGATNLIYSSHHV